MNITDEPGPVWKITGPGGMSEAAGRAYTTEDVAAALRVGPSTIRAYSARQQMPRPSGRLGRTPYWTPEDIEPWISARRARNRKGTT